MLTYAQRAVIKESLRLSYGAPGRAPRVVPKTGARFCGYNIAPGVREYLPELLVLNLCGEYNVRLSYLPASTCTTWIRPFSPIRPSSDPSDGLLKIRERWINTWLAFPEGLETA